MSRFINCKIVLPQGFFSLQSKNMYLCPQVSEVSRGGDRLESLSGVSKVPGTADLPPAPGSWVPPESPAFADTLVV